MSDASEQLPPCKRVITGHNAAGPAVVSSIRRTANVFPLAAVPGTVFHEIWNSSGAPATLDNAEEPTRKHLQLNPGPLGGVIRVVDIPPDSLQNRLSAEEVAAAFTELGLAHAVTGKSDSRHKLVRRIEILDYGVVTESEVWLVLDEEEVQLKRGEVVAQRGTNHAWNNRTEAMPRMVSILLYGRFSPELCGGD